MQSIKQEKLRFGKITAFLLTIVFMSYYYYGIRVVYVAGLSVITSVLCEYIACTARRVKYDWSDTSPIMSGLLLALLMPASVPYTVIAFGSAFMALICKHAFGGNKNLIFCPVCVAYIFTLFCFPSYIVRYPTPVPFGSVSTSNIVTDTLSHSYTYYLDNGASAAFSLLDIVWGKLAGPMGTSALLIILIAGIALYFFGDLPTAAFFAGFGANVLINVMFPVGETGWYAVLNSQVAGSYLFVLVFMACDRRYVPSRLFSQVVYGILFAAASYLIRVNTGIENGALFALPILCIFRDEFDRLTGALERLTRFLWKWIKIITARLAKYIWKYTVIVSKWIAKMFDRACDKIAAKIAEKSRESADAQDEKNDKPKEDAGYKISKIVGIVKDEPCENNRESSLESALDNVTESARDVPFPPDTAQSDSTGESFDENYSADTPEQAQNNIKEAPDV